MRNVTIHSKLVTKVNVFLLIEAKIKLTKTKKRKKIKQNRNRYLRRSESY